MQTPEQSKQRMFFDLYIMTENTFSPNECQMIIDGKIKKDDIIKKLHKALTEASNNSNWNYVIEYAEDPKVVEVSYDWKIDKEFKPGKDGTKRLISCYMNLTHPIEYDYGDFMVRESFGSFKQGVANFYPSYYSNRVSKLDRGKKYGLVVHYRGKGTRGKPQIYNEKFVVKQT